ncbi:MAG TPA: efflux transporter periplasmic adaptor subunit, partial [Actinomycetes bacterium]|nr:efflux transporter periplasmic adaptor subunit [Actinomycetes bacterium]
VRLDLRGGTTAAGEPAPTPRPGMSAVASLRVKVARDVVAVPVSTVFRDGDADAAWLDVDGRARKVPVVVGAQGADDVEILEGLDEGDRVVVSGADLVSEGQELP